MSPSKNCDSLAYVDELKDHLCLYAVYSETESNLENILSLFRSTPTGLLHTLNYLMLRIRTVFVSNMFANYFYFLLIIGPTRFGHN
jgi:hypothetical protein